MSKFTRFLYAMLAFDTLGFLLGALFSPPDPTTQLYFFGLPTIVLAPMLAYALVYRLGFGESAEDDEPTNEVGDESAATAAAVGDDTPERESETE